MQPQTIVPTMAEDQGLASVRKRLPGWDVWRVHVYAAAYPTWCGRPVGAIVGIRQIESYSPVSFLDRVAHFEARIDMHIAATRAELTALPPHRPETPDRRKVLDAQLAALLRLQKRLLAS